MKIFAVLRKLLYSCILNYMFLQSTEGKNKTAVLAQQQLLQYQYRVLRGKVKLFRRSNADRIIEIKGKFSGVATMESILDKLTLSSLLECAVTCRANDQCQSYFWNSLHSECQRQLTLYTTSNGLHANRTGNSYFVTEDNLVTATGESLTNSLCRGAGYNISHTGIMCYQIENRKHNHDTAARQCADEGGHLVRVDSTKKFVDIEAVVIGEALSLYVPYVFFEEKIDTIYEVGVRLLVDGQYTSEGMWKFSDGSLMNMLDFVPKQPDSFMQDGTDSSGQDDKDSSDEDDKDCIVLVNDNGMIRINDVSCDEKFTFICEIELI